MRKLCVLAALILAIFVMPALADEFEAIETGPADFVVLEGGTQLVRVPRGGGESKLVDKGSEITCLTALGNDVYYLKNDGGWSVCVFRADGTGGTICAFDSSARAANLSAWNGNLLLLLNDQLRILYPTSGVCLLYISQQMTEYAVSGEYVYYAAKGDTILYSDEATGLSATAGCLYRANLTTGNTSVVLKTGIGELMIADETLYFRNYSDYVVENGQLTGRYYSFDLTTETLTQLSQAEQVMIVNGKAMILTESGLALDGSVIAVPEEGTQLASAGTAVSVYAPEKNGVSMLAENGTSRAVYSGEEYDVYEGSPAAATVAPTEAPRATMAPGADAWYSEYSGDAGYDVYDDENTK